MKLHMLFALFAAVLVASGPSAARERDRTKDRQKLTEQEIRTDQRLYRQATEGDLFLHFYYPPDWKEEDARPAIVLLWWRLENWLVSAI